MQIAILGCGRMGRRHAEAYRKNSKVMIKGFYDIEKSQAINLASHYDATVFNDVYEIMDNSDIDAVSICTPNAMHFEFLKIAIKTRKNVLVEKPIVTTKEHCDTLLRIMKGVKCKVMVGHTHRFYPCNITLKLILESGRYVGEPKIINTFDYIPGRNLGDKMPSWIKHRKFGGGILMTDFIHTVDKISWLVNSPIQRVHTHMLSNFITKKNVEDTLVATLELKNGLIATCVHGCPSPGAVDMSLKVIGTKGEIDMKFASDLTILKDSISSIDYPHKGDYMRHAESAFSAEINEFINSIISDREPEITYKDGIQAVRVILALHESFKRRKSVFVNI
ncbi:MAG: Gfo/Idh/MocA family oxidoreductase [Candidatus Nitrosotenuis sp.]